MGLYKYLSKLWQNPKKHNLQYRDHLVAWRDEPVLVRVDKPTRVDRARSLGYKAKQGVVVIRARIRKGGRKREATHMGRKPSKAGKVHFSPKQSLQNISEIRVAKKYPNLRVLNSYEVGDDGKHKWYEVILIDTGHPQIFKDKDYAPLCTNKHRGRESRGLTSSAKISRGLKNKGIGAEKLRPSIRAHGRMGK
ncbi:50S ribosomal protein L15e [Candidatus Tiddalikarchaeum anstoanum]|nr:50S ribosomal protein L15e [Candidatus Tiddalikarchaeum anstoanum]